MELHNWIMESYDLVGCPLASPLLTSKEKNIILQKYPPRLIFFLHSGPAGDGRAAPVARGVRM